MRQPSTDERRHREHEIPVCTRRERARERAGRALSTDRHRPVHPFAMSDDDATRDPPLAAASATFLAFDALIASVEKSSGSGMEVEECAQWIGVCEALRQIPSFLVCVSSLFETP